ncbi:MAG: DUF5615 family PIN-like protein [Salinarimonas sp.]
MRFLIDECLSPSFVRRRVDAGHDAVHPLHIGRLGDPDHLVLRSAIESDRILVTENERAFRRLLRSVELHPGLIIVPNVSRDEGWRLLLLALTALLERDDARPEDGMVSRILIVTRDGRATFEGLP